MKMQKMEKESSSSSASEHYYLPVEIVTQIINKVVDLKTLCVCKGVSKGLLEIASQVDTIVYSTDPDNYLSHNFKYAMKSLRKFPSLKVLRVVLPSRPDERFYKWKMTFGRRYNSFVFLSPDDLNEETDSHHKNDHGVEEEEEEEEDYYGCLIGTEDKCDLGKEFLEIAVDWFKEVWRYLKGGKYNPLLQLVLIKDSANKGRITAKNISKLRRNLKRKDVGRNILEDHAVFCHAPSLKLPVSGYVMKGVTMVLYGHDKYDYRVEDEEEKIYNEAIKEMWRRGDFEYVEFAFGSY